MIKVLVNSFTIFNYITSMIIIENISMIILHNFIRHNFYDYHKSYVVGNCGWLYHRPVIILLIINNIEKSHRSGNCPELDRFQQISPKGVNFLTDKYLKTFLDEKETDVILIHLKRKRCTHSKRNFFKFKQRWFKIFNFKNFWSIGWEPWWRGIYCAYTPRFPRPHTN